MHSRKKRKIKNVILYAVIGVLAALNVFQFIANRYWIYNDVLPDEVAALSMANIVAENAFGEKFASPEIRYTSVANTWTITETAIFGVVNPEKQVVLKKDSGRTVKVTAGKGADDSHIAL